MRVLPAIAALVLGLCGLTTAASDSANRLTEAEMAEGWVLLFDGQSTRGWRSFKKTTFPQKGWKVEDGCLRHVAGGGGGDIMTESTFGEFELTFEWRLAAGANSGVKYFITEERAGPIGHEYQLVTKNHPEAEDLPTKHVTASFYDVLPTTAPVRVRSAPDFNQSRIVVRGQQVEHWLNGDKVLAYELGSDDVKAAISRSKFRDVPGFGTRLRGNILLQDHGGEVCFRNVKLREPREH